MATTRLAAARASKSGYASQTLSALPRSLLDPQQPGGLSPRIFERVADMRAEWHEFDRRIAALNAEFAELAGADAKAGRLLTIPGVGVLGGHRPGGRGRLRRRFPTRPATLPLGWASSHRR